MSSFCKDRFLEGNTILLTFAGTACVGAIIIHSIALATAVWSAHETRVHDKLSLLPAPVWHAEGSLEADEIGLVFTNQGLGPLTLDQLRIYFDGERINDWGPVMNELTDTYADKDVTASWNLYDKVTIGSKGQMKFFYIKPKFIIRDNANEFRDVIDRLFLITRAAREIANAAYEFARSKRFCLTSSTCNGSRLAGAD